MKRKFFTIIMILLVSMVLVSTVSAGGNVGLKSVQFFLGSLTMTGTVTGLGGYPEGVDAVLTASGIPVVTCSNQGGNQAPGQNPSRVSAEGQQFLGPDTITKNGTAPLEVTTETESITGKQGGCPNNNWSAHIDFVFWTNATISLYDGVTNDLLLEQHYTCKTTRYPAGVTCTEVP